MYILLLGRESPGRRILHRKCLLHRTRITAQGIRARCENRGKGSLSLSLHPRSWRLPTHGLLLCPLDRPATSWLAGCLLSLLCVFSVTTAILTELSSGTTVPERLSRLPAAVHETPPSLFSKFTCHQTSNVSQGCPPPFMTASLSYCHCLELLSLSLPSFPLNTTAPHGHSQTCPSREP